MQTVFVGQPAPGTTMAQPFKAFKRTIYSFLFRQIDRVSGTQPDYPSVMVRTSAQPPSHRGAKIFGTMGTDLRPAHRAEHRPARRDARGERRTGPRLDHNL